jgi:cytochrome b pre-mRNA-processing protein 3
MISRLFRRTPGEPSIAPLYGTIVAQARGAHFYESYGVPDTINGRLEMIMLHVVLVLLRLEDEPAPVRKLGQGLFDHFCRDMDASMREMGVGDLAVPRKMRAIGEAFYGRQAAYRAALAVPEPTALASALARNVYDAAPPLGCAERLATYVRQTVGGLADQDSKALVRAEIAFPDPAQVPGAL